MAIAYIREQGAMLKKRGGRILVEKDGETLAPILMQDTEEIAVFGGVQVTTQVISELLKRGIGISLFTRNGRFKGRVAPPISGQVELRLRQYEAVVDVERALRWSRAFVRAKLEAAAGLVSDYRRNYPSAELEIAEGRIRAGREAAGGAGSQNEVLGCEGAAAAAYFRAWPAMNRSELEFPGRRAHPSTDPVNALLSLGYTLVLNELSGLVEAHGLEPHLGFLHQPLNGRHSLALDLLEPFRPEIVDRLTLSLINERVFRAEDFARPVSGPRAGSVVLLPAGFRRYLGEYEKFMLTPRVAAPGGPRRLLQDEVSAVARAVREGEIVAAFPWEAACTT